MTDNLNYEYANSVYPNFSGDQNQYYRKQNTAIYIDPKISMNGTDREIKFTHNNRGLVNQDDSGKFAGNNFDANNHFSKYFYKDRRGPGDAYSYYAYQEIPTGGWQPRSRANGAEYFQSSHNKNFYRRQNAYELQNNVIHPTHYMEITPERLAADPNQMIYNYHKGCGDESDKNTARVFEFSRQRTNARKNNRKISHQIMLAFEHGNAHMADELEPLYW
jgi:hypothetical protein